MKLRCRVLGHKWKDGRCIHCHKHHNEREHKWVPVEGQCKEICSICGETHYTHRWNGCICTVCGKIQYLSPILAADKHTWNGCTCINCGINRDENHRWAEAEHECYRICAVCKKQEQLPHKYHRISGQCSEVCTVCGAARPIDHTFKNGICTTCDIGEDEYYVEMSLNGEYSKGDPMDYIKKVKDLNIVSEVIKKRISKYGRVQDTYSLYATLNGIKDDKVLVSIARDEDFSLDIRERARDLISDPVLKDSIELPANILRLAMEAADARTGM